MFFHPILRATLEKALNVRPQIGLTNLEILPSNKPENLSKTELSPFEYVINTATQKCLDVYETAVAVASVIEPTLVIAADTIIITQRGLILEKPRNEVDHIMMLKALRDQGSHKVVTAVAVLSPREDARAPGYNMETAVEETKVVFDEAASDELIISYVKTREGVDKAGGYGIQGMGSLLVKRIEGSCK
jgi:MAF protein